MYANDDNFLIQMEMESLFNCSDYRTVKLNTAADVVQYSFIVQKSILYLNLELSQSHQVKNSFLPRNYPSFSYSSDFINTEEKCRKIHGNRKLLYFLHLDMPATRERCLLLDSELECKRAFYYKNNWRESLFEIPLRQIYIKDNFHIDKLFQFVDDALKHNYDKTKILKWLLEYDAILPEEFKRMPNSIIASFADCMLPGQMDTQFVNQCLMKVDFCKWISFNDKSERLANVLYQVHRTGRRQEIMSWCYQLVARCFFDESFRYIYEVLKFLDTPKFYYYFEKVLFHSLYLEFGLLETARHYYHELLHTRVTFEMRFLMIHLLLWIHIKSRENSSAAINAVRLIWNSVSDIFLSLKEMEVAYRRIGLTPEETEDVYNFYCQAVGKFDSYVKPRLLQHYCRTTIRRTLWKNNQWLPDGIKQIDLPPKCQSYLNLDS